MAILEVLKEPNPLLRQKSLPVEAIDINIKTLLMDMFETMHHEQGVGIAAIQVGKPIRAFIVDVPLLEERQPFFILNPKITFLSEEKIVLPEGCLSVKKHNDEQPEFIRGDVERPVSITISYADLNGQQQISAIDGTKSKYDMWLARCLQHELDHLDGVLFIDKLHITAGVDEEIEVIEELSENSIR